MFKKMVLVSCCVVTFLLICGCGKSDVTSTHSQVQPILQTEKEVHKHIFSWPTCDKAGLCSCGAERGVPMGHNLLNGVCTDCGASPRYNVGNLLILGDSYSTFEGCVPNGNAVWYKSQTSPNTDVVSADQTWWKIFVKNTGAQLVLNESYSGSTVCYTGYDGSIVPLTSFIGRFDKAVCDGTLKDAEIDTIIIFGGTNDSWAGSPIGSVQYSDWDNTDKLSFLPSFCYLLDTAVKNFPKARIVCVINDILKPEISEGMAKVCDTYGVQSVQLSNIDKQSGHPNISGMLQIERQIRAAFENN